MKAFLSAGWLLSLCLASATPAWAQQADERPIRPASAIAGLQTRHYSFDRDPTRRWVRQVAVPVIAVVPIGRRLVLDASTRYADTRLKPRTGPVQSVNGMTDTQLRAAYTFGHDAIVAALMVNLPTGLSKSSLTDFITASSVASNFLSYPVNSYSNGFSVTSGLAGATQAGAWSLGLAGSLRVNSTFRPIADSLVSLRYKPGVEGRVRLGADRIVGASRLTLGLTYSTFGTDDAAGAAGSGSYHPGDRLLGEGSLVSPFKGGLITTYLWNYYRAHTSRVLVVGQPNRENVFAVGVTGRYQLNPTFTVEPVVEARLWSPEHGSGALVGLGTGVRWRIAPRLGFTPALRFDTGSLKAPSSPSVGLSGWYASGLLRYDLR